jgi:thiamine phosphate synthase YjbQ (UPF0047 family)
MTTTTLLPVPTFRLEVCPATRPDVVDLRPRIRETLSAADCPSVRRVLVLSHHTTAGFLDRVLRERVGDEPERVHHLLEALASVFPPEAGYEHDRLHLRDELTSAQKEREPLNADAHLAFIGGGFTNGTVATLKGRHPIWLVDFDGVYRDRAGESIRRTREVTVVGFDVEEQVARFEVGIPVPGTAAVVRVDEPSLGLYARVEEEARRAGITAGRVRLRLPRFEPGVGVTVNEFEALLMERDLTRVLANPMGFARGGAVAMGRALQALGLPEARVRRLLTRAMASPSPRILRMQQEMTLGLLPPHAGEDPGEADIRQEGEGAAGPARPSPAVVRGTYQSPLLVQRQGCPSGERRIQVTLTRFR